MTWCSTWIRRLESAAETAAPFQEDDGCTTVRGGDVTRFTPSRHLRVVKQHTEQQHDRNVTSRTTMGLTEYPPHGPGLHNNADTNAIARIAGQTSTVTISTNNNWYNEETLTYNADTHGDGRHSEATEWRARGRAHGKLGAVS